MTNYMSFSQDLKPKIQQIDGQPHFCFTFSQSLKIAQLLETGTFDADLVNQLTQSNTNYKQLVTQKENIINVQEEKIYNLLLVSENCKQSQILWEQRLQSRDKIIKRSKLHKTLLGIGVVLLGTIAITK